MILVGRVCVRFLPVMISTKMQNALFFRTFSDKSRKTLLKEQNFYRPFFVPLYSRLIVFKSLNFIRRDQSHSLVTNFDIQACGLNGFFLNQDRRSFVSKFSSLLSYRNVSRVTIYC